MKSVLGARMTAVNEHGTSDGGGAPVDKEARKKERRQQKEAKVLKAMEAKKNVPPPVKKEKFVAKAALPACEVEANLEIDVTSLVSTKGFESKDGEPPREKFYLTTAINYTNGDPHIGHAYEAITADVLSRYQRISGKEVFFLTGSDEHGQKIANTAASLGVEPIDICNKYAANFQALNKRLLISNDTYIRTTMEHHKESSRKLWSICAEKGDIYLGKYEGWYDEREEKYVTDSDAEIANFQDAYGTPLKRMSEDSYFFRMGKYTDWLIKHIEDNPQFIQPETHRSGILKRLSSGHQGDLSISRTTFKHGISLPDNFDKEHVIYVWFDALSSYLSGIHALEEADPTAAFWPASVHIIGKDITWFHCVIWPSMLKSAGLTMPKTVFAHGFVSAEDGRKMSKSLGNVVDPHQICNQYPVDTFRWYICRDAIYGCDLSFSKTSLVLSHNSELCDTLGNLVHRSLSLMDKYNAGAVPSRQAGFDFKPFDFAETRREIDKAMDNYALQDACAIAMAALRDTNKFLQDEEPWKRKAPEDAPRRLESVRICLEAVYAVAHFLVAFLPTACTRIFEKLGLAPVPIGSLKEDFTNIPEGTKLTVGSILFQKLELPSDENDAPACNGNGEQAQPKTVASPAASAGVARSGGGTAKVAKGVSSKGTGKPGANAEGDSFTRIEIRVGRVTKMVGSYCIGRYRESNTLLGPANAGRFKVVKVWNHEEADRLYCEEIDVGEDAPREIASGLREHLTLEQFQGSLVLVVCNLRAARLAGFSSNGMVLAAKGLDGKVELVRAPEGSVVGERVRVEGLEGEPLTAAQVKKKKAFEDLAQYLRTDDKCVATYKGEPFLTSGGPCTVDTVTGAPIS